MSSFFEKLPYYKENYTDEQIYKIFFFGNPNYELEEDEEEIFPKQDVDSYFKNIESSFKVKENRIGKLLNKISQMTPEKREKFLDKVLKLTEGVK